MEGISWGRKKRVSVKEEGLPQSGIPGRQRRVKVKGHGGNCGQLWMVTSDQAAGSEKVGAGMADGMRWGLQRSPADFARGGESGSPFGGRQDRPGMGACQAPKACWFCSLFR